MLLRDVVFALLLIVLAVAASAEDAPPAVDDPALEAQVTRVSQLLRCLVCQNQTLADSQAGLAEDLKREIRDQLRGGASEPEVIDFMVARYGDFVLYRPPFKHSTWLLWLGPFALAGLALYGFLRRLQRRRGLDLLISEEDARQGAALLERGSPRSPTP